MKTGKYEEAETGVVRSFISFILSPLSITIAGGRETAFPVSAIAHLSGISYDPYSRNKKSPEVRSGIARNTRKQESARKRNRARERARRLEDIDINAWGKRKDSRVEG